MNAKIWAIIGTVVGLALVLGAAVLLYKFGGESLAAPLVAVGAGLGGVLIKAGGVFGGSVKSARKTGVVGLVAVLVLGLVACDGCGPGYSTRIPDNLRKALEHASVNTLKATPAMIRLAYADKAWADPVAGTIEECTAALLRSAEAALNECVDPGPLVEDSLAAVEHSLVLWGHEKPSAYVAVLRPIFEEAVADIWPYPVGHCPFEVVDAVDAFDD